MHCWFQSIIEINLTTFNSLFCSTVDITLTIRMFKTSYVCSFHFCDLFFRTLLYFPYMNSDDWLPKTVILFTDFFLIQKQSYHFTEIKIHLFRFSRGVYTSLFMKHKRMLFLVRFHRKSNQLSPSAFSAKKYGWTEKQSAGHSTKTGAKCWWSDWKVFSAVNNTVDWFM